MGTDHAGLADAATDEARVALLRELAGGGYQFVTPTPATHARVLARPAMAANARDVFGWNREFSADLLDRPLWDLLRACDAVVRTDAGWRATVRIASLDGLLFLHSAFPTTGEGSVFFGPDSYRFANFIRRELPAGPTLRITDLGAGAGVGGLIAKSLRPGAAVTLVDVNPVAIQYALVNAQANSLTVATRLQSDLAGVDSDVIIANPPYLLDGAGRTYRDGGGDAGEGLSVQWAQEAARRLPPGGVMLLYTGSAIVDGCDHLRKALTAIEGLSLAYREVDPDVFGEELTRPGYENVERIAVVEAVLRRG